MMNKFIFVASLAITFAVGSIASAFDLHPPEWRNYPGSTYQMWEFNSDDPEPAPTVVNNLYGDPHLRVTSSGDWIKDPGAWALGEIDTLIPNLGMQNPQKLIQIQLTWQTAYNDPFLPEEPLVGITATPLPYNTLIPSRNDNDLGNGWIHSTYNILIWPNPYEEWITIKGDILVDELVIDTLCVPEPATICLLGLGTLTLLKKRRV